jgi:DNA-binding response OmpR family regulator
MRKNILVIDDDESVRSVLEDILIYADFNVKSSSGANGIFDTIKDFKPDLVLMDYILLGVNGGEICHQIKINDQTAHLPVILISAYPKVLQSLGDYGCDEFIAKPFDLEQLVSCVNNCLTHSVIG